jgi:hypothetical protein
MDKQLFDDAIGEVPPSTIDVDAAIVRGRRAVRLRRVANPAVAAGVAVVLLSGAVAYTMTRDDDGGTGVAAPPTTKAAPTTRQSPVPVPGGRVGPPQCAEEPRETAAEAAARLSPAAVASVLAQRPELELMPGNEYPLGTAREPLELYQVSQSPTELPICDGRARYEGSALLRGPEGTGMLFLIMNPAWVEQQQYSCTGFQEGDTTQSCDEFTTPAGDEVKVLAMNFPGGRSQIDVTARRADGTEVTAVSGDLSTASKNGRPSDVDVESLDVNQLVEIATDPDLTLFPR